MKKIVPIIALLGLLISCAQEPAKANLAIGTPTNNSVFYLPDTFNIEGSLQDGTMDQYKIDMDLMSPCELIDSTSDGIYFGGYEYLYVSNLNYDQSTFSQTASFAADFTPGAYNCIVSCITQGYTQGYDTAVIYLKNLIDTINPTLSLALPSGPTVIDKGDTLLIRGLMVENRTGMITGQMRRAKVMLEANFGGQNPLTIANQFPPVDPNDSLKLNYVIPMSIASGSYTLKITLLDEFNNFTIYTYSVNVN